MSPQPFSLQTPYGLRFFGKYRGTVLENNDPLRLGRVLANVPAVPGMLLNWANPCVPYAGLEVGFFALPPIAANVWIEFEAGDPSYPIWSGCFWELGEIPPAALASVDPSLVKAFCSDSCTLIFNDTPEAGGITLKVNDPAVAVPVTMTFNSAGVAIHCGTSNILINPETGIKINTAESVVTLTEAAITATSADVNVTANVSIKGPVEVTGNVDITGTVGITGETNVTGAVKVTGGVNVGGVLEVGGDANVTGGLEVEGEANFAGAATMEGDANVSGILTLEGDANFLGAGQVEGNWAVLGTIEGVLVPPGL